MALTPEHVKWVKGFAGMEALKTAFDREIALKAEHIKRIRAEVEREREILRDAMTFNVKIDGKKVGKMLEDKGTQLDEVDFAELGPGFELSEERAKKVHHVQVVLANLTESTKQIMVDRVDSDGKTIQVRLFSDQEIADEIYTPLVRERVLPETVIGNVYSETQKMIDQTNALYEHRIAEKKEAGELDEYDRGGAIISLSGGLTKVAANLAGNFTGADAKMAKDILDLCALGIETGGELRDAIKNSGFPDAAGTIVDNIGTILGKAVAMATGDQDLADLVANGYKASTSAIKAGAHFSKGEAGLNDGLQALAGGLGDVASMVGDDTVKQALIISANGLANAGTGYKVGEALASGDTKGVVDGLTQAAKVNLSNVMKLQTIDKSSGKSKEEREQIAKSQSETQESIEEIIDWSSLGLQTVANTYDAAKQRDIAGSVNSILDGIGGALAGVLKRAGVPDATADIVANSYAAAIQGPKIASHLIKNPPEQSEALAALGTGFESAFKAGFPGNDNLQKVGAGLSGAFAASGKGLDMKRAYDDGNYDDVVDALEGLTTGIAEKLFSIKKDVETSGKSGKAKEEIEETIDGEQSEVLETLATPDNVKNALATLKEVSPSEVAANTKKQEELEALALMENTERELDEMKRLLQQGGEAGMSAADASSIDKLIAQMVKDRMILDMAAKIAEGGTALAAKFCPALEAANSAAKLAANIYKAAIRAMELNKWMNNKKDFARAQSALTSASQNFVKNQAEQFSHYTIQAALDAVQMIGQIASCSGIAAAAGTAISNSAAAASEAEKLLYDFARREELERAWRVTCKAFNNPQNRKLALQARSLNPTLSKYCIAWGAMVDNDPLAKNAVAGCGLNETTLSQKDSNVDKVVTYLEIYFRDDLTLYREIELDGDWLPKEIVLTTKSWSAVKSRAVKEIKLKNPDTGKLDGMLAKLGRLQRDSKTPDLDAMIDALEGEELTEVAALFDDIKSEFGSYKPDCDFKGKKVIDSVVQILGRTAGDHLSASKRRLAEPPPAPPESTPRPPSSPPPKR